MTSHKTAAQLKALDAGEKLEKLEANKKKRSEAAKKGWVTRARNIGVGCCCSPTDRFGRR